MFSANKEELERVEVFKYLGQLISHDDADTQAMRSNLRKARECWAQVSHVLRAENATPKTCRMFYKATVQAVLLYGSETWSLSPSSVKHLEGFHICASWRISGKRPVQKEDGSWTYPRSEDVLQAVGLKPIVHYVAMWQQTVANSIVNQPIYELCAGAVRKRGLPVQPFWWDQPMDLDLVWKRGHRPLSNQGRDPAVIKNDKDYKLDGL
jgi:hypothetical protein